MPTSSQPATHRFDTVDLVRGLSILIVLLDHIKLFWFDSQGLATTHPLRDALLLDNASHAMQAFFVVSGFLITYTSLRRFSTLQQVRPLTFYRIRVARIAPLLVLLVLVLSALDLAHVPGFHINPQVATLPRALFAVFTFHVNWLQASRGWLPWNWSILWSLSVEETFYFFFPLICFALPKRWGTLPFFLLLLALILAGPIARLPPFRYNQIWALESYYGNMDSVAIGCSMALLLDLALRRRWFSTSAWPLALQCLGAALVLMMEGTECLGGGVFKPIQDALHRTATLPSLFALGVGLFVLGGVLRNVRPGRALLPLRWLGRYSYEVYLTHEFVILGIWSILPASQRTYFHLATCVILALASVLGLLIARLFSEPMNRLLRGGPLPSQLKP